MTPELYTLDLQFRRPGAALPSVPDQLGELFRFTSALARYSDLFGDWHLAWGNGKADALKHKAFDANGPAPEAVAVLEAQFAGVDDIHAFSIWNAREGAEGVAISSRASTSGRPDQVSLKTKVRPAPATWQEGAAWVEAALAVWPASFAGLAPLWYNEKAVFKDRPGVGWMLFLPQVLTVQQVPEARALVAVNDARAAQSGTLVVSAINAPFSLENAEHVAVANAIEVRLVDQEFLPRYLEI